MKAVARFSAMEAAPSAAGMPRHRGSCPSAESIRDRMTARDDSVVRVRRRALVELACDCAPSGLSRGRARRSWRSTAIANEPRYAHAAVGAIRIPRGGRRRRRVVWTRAAWSGRRRGRRAPASPAAARAAATGRRTRSTIADALPSEDGVPSWIACRSCRPGRSWFRRRPRHRAGRRSRKDAGS